MSQAVLEAAIIADWIDYNGHMNDAAYARVFSLAGDALMDRIGLDAASRAATGRTIYTLQMMLHYFREAKLGEAIAVSARVLEFDAKRMRSWMEMTRPADGARLAAAEMLLLSVDDGAGKGKAASWLPWTAAAIAARFEAEAGAPMPVEAGRGVTLKKVR